MGEGPVKVKDLIISSFSSRVGILCSTPAESIVQKHNLKFTQLLQPFGKLTTEASWQEPNGQLIWPKDLTLTFVDISSWKKSEVDVQRNRRLLNNVVTQTAPPYTKSLEESTNIKECKIVTLHGKSLNYQVCIPERTTWFETWRKTFLKLQSDLAGSQHEFLNHFVACILVISTSEVKSSDDVATVVGKLSKIQQQHQYDHPNNWVLPTVLKYYLILQDIETNENEAEQVYQNFRTMYGGNCCHLLKVGVKKAVSESDILVSNPWKTLVELENCLNDTGNKLNDTEGTPKISIDEVETIVPSDVLHPLSPDCETPPVLISQNGDISNCLKSEGKSEYGSTLTLQDIRHIRIAINDFVSKALLPYMERQCKNLHESIINRRGMSKSFFSATKRLFGTTSKSAPSIVYASESVEILSRKLADLYFLFGNYGGAYQLYHQLKKDFYGDAAWLYYSSALELAAISHFMMSQSEPPLAVARAFPVHYVNDAIGHYLDQCRMVDAATRCAVICAECLKQLDNNAEAAAIFIRMTSEDCDLRSALMLEQAAYSFLEMNSPRKYALHSVLAGYRYAKAGLKSHSLNSYHQGHQIYNGKGWRYAEDHVNYTIARLQNALQMPDGITKHLMATLVAPSPQSSQQIQTFFKEFHTTMGGLTSVAATPFEFFVPQIKFSEMKIKIAVTDLPVGECENSNYTNDDVSTTNWESLEEGVARECFNNSVISFKPTRLFFSKCLDNTVHPTVPCEEQFYIELPFFNSLKIQLSLRNITLKFDNNNVTVNSIAHLELEPESTKILRFCAVSHHIGMVVLEAVYYELEHSGNMVSFQQSVVLKGPRLNNTKEERWGKIYAKDLRNKIVVVNKLPLLQANVEGLPETFFHAQTADFHIVLKDKSISEISDMQVSKVVIAMDNMEQIVEVLQQASHSENFPKIKSSGKNFTQLVCENGNHFSKIPCVFKAPQTGENTSLDILILYEILSKHDPVKKTYRVIRASIQISLSPAVHVEYSSLKMLDCFTYLGLLRLYNLTVDYNIIVKRIFFNSSEVAVSELCTSTSSTHNDNVSTEEDEIMKMNRNESRNIVLKFRDPKNVLRDNRSASINVEWKIPRSKTENSAVGNSQTKIYEALTSIQSSFIFQFKHKNNISADFVTSSFCECDVELLLHSRKDGNYTVQLEKNPPNEDIASSTPPTSTSGDVFFTGKTLWNLTLESLKTETIKYAVSVPWPGVYNVAPKITVTDTEKGVQEVYILHSPMIVAQSSTSSSTS